MHSETAPVGTVDPLTAGHLYKTSEVAKLLRVCQHTVQVWIRTGALPAVRYGKLLRIRHQDLVAFGAVVQPSEGDAPPLATVPTP